MFRGGILKESARELAADFVSAFFKRGEIEFLEVFVRTVNVPRDFTENLQEGGVEGGVCRG